MASPAEPPPRYWHFSSPVHNRNLCVYGGGVDGGEGSTVLHVFSTDVEKWEITTSRGEVTPPQDLCHGACQPGNNGVYIYGGQLGVGGAYSSCLYRLDTNSMLWSILSRTVGEEGPMAKCGCRMISYQNKLILCGGRGNQPTGPGGGGVYTNELHTFDLEEGERSSLLYQV